MAEQRINRHLALEMTMQEVLGSLEELALDFGYSNGEDCFEIIAIEPCQVPDSAPQHSTGCRLRAPITGTTPLKHRHVA